MTRTSLPLDSVIRSSTNVSLADLGGEAVLLDVESGTYFGVNAVGRFVLSVLEQPKTLNELIGEVAQKFSVDEDRAREDLLPFISQLAESKLITVASAEKRN